MVVFRPVWLRIDAAGQVTAPAGVSAKALTGATAEPTPDYRAPDGTRPVCLEARVPWPGGLAVGQRLDVRLECGAAGWPAGADAARRESWGLVRLAP